MGMASDGGTAGGARRYSSRRGRGVLVVLLPLVLLICLAAAVAEAAEGQQRQLRRRKKGGGDDKGQSAPAHRDESRNVHGDSGMALGESLGPATFVLETECGKFRSGAFLHFQDRDWEEREIMGELTTVVPFYGLRYAAPLASAEQRWRPPDPSPCPFRPPSPTASPSKDSGGSSTSATEQQQQQQRVGGDDEEGVYDAGAYRGPCIQADGTGVEDCLFLNVFSPLATLQALQQQQSNPTAPRRHYHRHKQLKQHNHHHHAAAVQGNKGANASSAEPGSGSAESPLLPVVVYIHGGGLMTGTAKGSPLAAIAGDPRFGPVVTVSLDHRLNVFGFLVLRELSEEQGGASGNYGLMDQLAALEWVQKHISAFGGDPERVTLIGHSSGGTSILALLGSPMAKGLFHRAISLSGSPNITISLHDAEAQNAGVVLHGPCAHQNGTAARLKCLRGLPIPTLLGLMPPNWSTPGLWDLPTSPKGQPYGGLPVVDGRVVARPFLEALDAGTVDVPFLLGSTGHEADCCTPRDLRNASVAEWVALLRGHFSPWGQGPALGERIAGFYLPEAGEDPQKALTALMADYGLVCGASEAARRAAHSTHFTSPVYTYVNLWAPSTPIPRADKQGMPMRYAFHGWDLTSWLRDYPAGYKPSPLDLEHSRLLRQAVFQFARDGHLHGAPPPGAQPLGWDAVDAVAGWPRALGVYVVQPPPLPPAAQGEGSGMVVDYKADVCDYYRTHGLWQPFWWAD